MPVDDRITLVVLTYRRHGEAVRTIAHHVALGEAQRLIVVDNGSGDGTAERLRREFEGLEVAALDWNTGAAGRNIGAQLATTRYVAFADDDSLWRAGALRGAVDFLDAHLTCAALTGHVAVGAERRDDPVSIAMATSALGGVTSRGIGASSNATQVLGMLACAAMVRREAFLSVGGFDGRFGVGGEEELVCYDLAARGWELAYLPGAIVEHHPSRQRDPAARAVVQTRNALWFSWLRLPVSDAAGETVRTLRDAGSWTARRRAALAALRGVGWIARERRVLPPPVAEKRRALRRREPVP